MRWCSPRRPAPRWGWGRPWSCRWPGGRGCGSWTGCRSSAQRRTGTWEGGKTSRAEIDKKIKSWYLFQATPKLNFPALLLVLQQPAVVSLAYANDLIWEMWIWLIFQGELTRSLLCKLARFAQLVSSIWPEFLEQPSLTKKKGRERKKERRKKFSSRFIHSTEATLKQTRAFFLFSLSWPSHKQQQQQQIDNCRPRPRRRSIFLPYRNFRSSYFFSATLPEQRKES